MNNDMRGLEVVAAKGRLLGLDMVYHCASGHLGGSFSAMDILTVLYFDVMRVDPKDPKDPDRDRFVLSKGHCTPALYPILAQRGYFPEEELQMFRSVEGHMSGHAEMHHVKGVDMSTGSLGQGISAAVGMALAGKLGQKRLPRLQPCWVTARSTRGRSGRLSWPLPSTSWTTSAPSSTSTAYRSTAQLPTSCRRSPWTRSWRPSAGTSSRWTATTSAALLDAFKLRPRTTKGQPTMILAKTVKGKGVSFMENQAGWHGKAPNEEQYATGTSGAGGRPGREWRASNMAEKIATRAAYGKALEELAAQEPNLVVLDADLAGATMTKGFGAEPIPTVSLTWASPRPTWSASPPAWPPAASSPLPTPSPCSPPGGPGSRSATPWLTPA